METAARIAILPYFAIVMLFMYRMLQGKSLIMGREDRKPYSIAVLGRVALISIMGVVGGPLLIGASMGFRT